MSRKVFDQLVEDAIAALPAEYARWLDEVPIIIEDYPGHADLDGLEDEDPDAPLGMFTGPTIADEEHSSGSLPPRIMIYRLPLLEVCASREQLAEEIRKTLLHELGHYAGMDEDQLEALGYGPPEDEEEIVWDVEDEEEGLPPADSASR